MDDQHKDEQPKLEKLIAEMRAGEAPVKLWLEKHLVWIIGVLAFVMGLIIGSLF